MLAAAAGVAAGGSALWLYNRENFMFDRKLRQEQEFAIFEWRKVQAELWREDIRDIIELTEKKMDNYLIVATLQLGMCAGLFSCGRLQPGTPPWLLHFYMLTLAGAFTYLLMAVWMAMHAGVAAQCASVRMLTQFVRLPVPQWEAFEAARTYAQSFETLRPEDMLRIPFTHSLATGDNGKSMPPPAQGPKYHDDEEAPVEPAKEQQQPRHADPWRLERHGSERNLYELQRISIDLRRHVNLARKAALQFQCFDAFARVSMSFGTHQLLYAISHFVLGCVAVQDGAYSASCSVVLLMMCISAMMMHVDFSMTRIERFVAVFVVFAALIGSAVSTIVWAERGMKAQKALIHYLLPVAYGSHALWLYVALRACGLKEQSSTGALLPVKFRAVLYLDVFGWLTKSPAAGGPASVGDAPQKPEPLKAKAEECQEPNPEPSPSQVGAGAAGSRRWGAKLPIGRRRRGPLMTKLLGARPEEGPAAGDCGGGGGGLGLTPAAQGGGGGSTARPSKAKRPHPLHSLSGPAGEPISYQPLYACSSEVGPDKPNPPRRCRSEGPEGEVRRPPEHAFEATTYCPKGMHDEDIDKMHQGSEVVTGHDRLRPTRTPATLFRSATILLIVLWLVGLLVPLELLHNFLAKPLIASIFVQTIDPKTGQVSGEKEVHALVGSDRNGLPELIPVMEEEKQIPRIGQGVKINVEWPSHSAFVPRALTCDPRGEWLVVADDFGLYAGRVQADYHQGEDGRIPRPSVAFQASPRCWALEGQAFNDIGGYCRSESDCGVLVLSEDGSTLTKCPFKEGEESPAAWRLAVDWLRQGETIQALAIRSTCVQQKAAEDPVPALSLQGRAGCVVVGTTVGRIVELESSAEGDPDLIVPEQVLVQRPLAPTHGSLADVPGGILLALWHTKGVISAFDQDGALVGEWRLPKHIHWLMVASGGPYIFALGVAREEAGAEDGAEGGGEEEEEEEIVHRGRHKGPEAEGRGREGQRRHKKKVSTRRVLVQLHRFRMPEELLQASQAAQPRLLEL